MSLLEKATIITTPTAHSNGTLHSIKGGAVADFDVVRGSAATRVNAEGLIEDISILSGELLANGDFSNGSTDWTLGTGWSVSDGKSVFIGSSSGEYLVQNNVYTLNSTIKLTFDVLDYVSGAVRVIGGGSVWVSGAASSNGTHTFYIDTSGAANNNIYIQAIGGVFNGSIDNISVIEVIDATNIPRIDYTSGEAVVLLEPQSTNLITYSEDFTQWTDAGTLTKTGNYSLSPSGEVNATRLQWSSGTNFTFQGLSHVGSDFTLSIYLKSNTDVSQNVRLFMDNGFQGKDVVVTTQWQRFELTNTTTPTQSNRNVGLIKSGGQVGDLDISIWGAQFEALPYSTSYIPTSGAIASRLADSVTGAGDATTFNSTEGVLYAEIARSEEENLYRLLGIDDGTSNNFVKMGFEASRGAFWIRAVINGVTSIFSDNALTSNPNEFYKIAIRYQSGNSAIYINGTSVLTTTTTFSSGNFTALDFNHFNNSFPFFGKTKCVAVWKEALSDEELTCLTTI